VGLSITPANYHRHSAYILQHADMPGFSNDDQELLAWLTLGQQGKLRKQGFTATPLQWQALLCLRLATLLCRRREDLPTLPLSLETGNMQIRVNVAESWLANHA